MEDEYLITIAVLHGCSFYCFGDTYWYPEQGNTVHEVERVHKELTGLYYWSTKEELARDYCAFYKLGTYGGNDGPKNDPTTDRRREACRAVREAPRHED